MATSSAEDVPRSLEFLFSRNRLNVAVSRAMCLALVVASPRLLESRARTIEQMRLINALCRSVEMAEAEARRRRIRSWACSGTTAGTLRTTDFSRGEIL